VRYPDESRWAAALAAVEVARSLVPLIQERSERVEQSRHLDALEAALVD
jgi:hypothetical protein